MSVCIVPASELAVIAVHATGCDDAYDLCAMLSSANVDAFHGQYGGERRAHETARSIATAQLPVDASLEDAAAALCHVDYNCVTNSGTDTRSQDELEAWRQLARAILAEQALQGLTGEGFDRLRRRDVTGAPPPPASRPRVKAANDVEPVQNRPHVPTNEACARMRAALKRRTGRSWRVYHGTGTAYCWIHIAPPAKRLVNGCDWTTEDRDAMRAILGRQNLIDTISPDEMGWALDTIEGK